MRWIHSYVISSIYIGWDILLLMTCTHMHRNHIHIITYMVWIHWWMMTCYEYDHIYAQIITCIVWDTPLMMTSVNTYRLCTLHCICNMDTLIYHTCNMYDNIHAQVIANIVWDMSLMMTCVLHIVCVHCFTYVILIRALYHICNMDTLIYHTCNMYDNIHAQITTDILWDMSLMMTCVRAYLVYTLHYMWNAYVYISLHK